LLWNRRTDEFEVGQWLKGRIYERRSDLSPDGRHLIYFAMDGRWHSETGGSWTAVSNAPWLKAVALFGKGDCWHGGGLFTSNDRFWLNDGRGHRPMLAGSLVKRDESYQPPAYYGGECPGVYYVRLLRDGWAMKPDLSNSHLTVFEKPIPHGWVLRKFAHAEIGAPEGKGCYWDEHELEHAETGRRIGGKGWEWAELDGKKLVWAEGGCLFKASIKGSGLGDAKLLHDFNSMEFEAVAAPY
jgi:hypothetical protein